MDVMGVEEVMSSPLRTVHPRATLEQCSRIMREADIRRLPVYDPWLIREGRSGGRDFLGIISDTNILQSLGHNQLADTKRRRKVNSVGSTIGNEDDGMGGEERRRGGEAQRSWEIDMSELKLISRIGRGSFGEVLMGRYCGTVVAVKQLHEVVATTDEEKSLRDFEMEIQTLSLLRHPNIISFLGASLLPPDVALVMEYCHRGSLEKLLHKPNSEIAGKETMRMNMMKGIAAAILYLHTRTPPIVHRDLKTANVLVTLAFEVKVCDFGLARTKCSSSRASTMKSLVGTIQYTAPEVFSEEDYKGYDERCDIWSLGVVLWEVYTMNRPYHQYQANQHRLMLLLSQRKLKPDTDLIENEKVRNVVNLCLGWDAQCRPTIDRVSTDLAGINS